MSDNVETIRSAYRQFSERGFDGVADLIHPDFESRGGLMEALGENRYHGPSGASKWFSDANEAWSELRFEPLQVFDVDETRVAAEVELSARGRESGAQTNARSWHVFVLRDGKVVRLDVFQNFDEAAGAVPELKRPADRA